jgi:hypothetical protein
MTNIIDAYMRTTLEISDALLKDLRARAAQRRRPFREIVEETLQKGLAASPPAGKRVKIQPHAVGIKAAYRGMSLNQLYDQVEAEQIQKVAES